MSSCFWERCLPDNDAYWTDVDADVDVDVDMDAFLLAFLFGSMVMVDVPFPGRD